jgi:hypothetical protein
MAFWSVPLFFRLGLLLLLCLLLEVRLLSGPRRFVH